MTNTGGIPAGWYHAQGDPAGTFRYWDGAQWIGEPQVPAAAPGPVGQFQPPQPPAPPAPPAGGFQASGVGAPPSYGAPGAPPTWNPQGAGAYGASNLNVGTPAEWWPRALAYLLDCVIYFGVFLAGLILFVISVALSAGFGIVMLGVWIVTSIAFPIWQFVFRQGRTGQTIGKKKLNIKLVRDNTGQPVGAGMAFVRLFLAGLFGSFLFGIYTLLDYLWPLWDPEKKRLTDKMITMSVVTA